MVGRARPELTRRVGVFKRTKAITLGAALSGGAGRRSIREGLLLKRSSVERDYNPS